MSELLKENTRLRLQLLREDCFEVEFEVYENLLSRIKEELDKEGLPLVFLKDTTIFKGNRVSSRQGMLHTNKNNFEDKTIVMGRGFSEHRNNILDIITIAHEFGHYIDMVHNFDNDVYGYFGKLGTLELEVRAWEFSIDILKEIGFKHWEVFKYFMQDCLESYYFGGMYQARDDYFGYQAGLRRSYTQAKNDILAKITFQ